MTSAKVLLAGEAESAEAIESALRKRDIETVLMPPSGVDSALVDAEQRLDSDGPQAAVAVGSGETALALAISAAKAGVPVVAVRLLAGSDPANNSRILATLASLEAEGDPERAADLIASWLGEGTTAQN